jgi:hypothetical protein
MRRKLVTILAIVFLIAGGGIGFFYYQNRFNARTSNVEEKKDNKYKDFYSQVYSTVANNYWEKLTEERFGKLWILAAENITSQAQKELKIINQESVTDLMDEITKSYPEESQRKEFANKLVDTVLSNLQPFGRSRLYTKKDEIALNDTVQNKSSVDQYKALGVDKSASDKIIKDAYTKEIEKWEATKDSSLEAKENYDKVQKAYQVLSDPVSKKNYDISGVEPTMEYRLLNPSTYYVHLTKFSPTSIEEFVRVMDKVKDKGDELNTLIFDLRNNIGGSIDIMPYFMGPFIGMDQYAYQFLHQEEKTDYKTKTSWLNSIVRYKKVIILINENSQSTAELMASVFKKYSVGVVVGVPSKGWGTVERVFPLDKQIDENEHNSIFLVHSLTLREDGLPIEGKGVEPDIDIRNKDWTKNLYAYFSSQELIETVKEIVENN